METGVVGGEVVGSSPAGLTATVCVCVCVHVCVCVCVCMCVNTD